MEWNQAATSRDQRIDYNIRILLSTQSTAKLPRRRPPPFRLTSLPSIYSSIISPRAFRRSRIMSDPRPTSPRSPRPGPPRVEIAPSLPPGTLVDLGAPPPAPRPSLSSMLFLTAFFFFMSGGNNIPEQQIVMGPNGEVQPRVTELDLARTTVEEYKGWIHGTGNWSEVSASWRLRLMKACRANHSGFQVDTSGI